MAKEAAAIVPPAEGDRRGGEVSPLSTVDTAVEVKGGSWDCAAPAVPAAAAAVVVAGAAGATAATAAVPPALCVAPTPRSPPPPVVVAKAAVCIGSWASAPDIRTPERARTSGPDSLFLLDKLPAGRAVVVVAFPTAEVEGAGSS